jgi:hypothetical protein
MRGVNRSAKASERNVAQVTTCAQVTMCACACNAPLLTLALHQGSIFKLVGRQVLWTDEARASQECLRRKERRKDSKANVRFVDALGVMFTGLQAHGRTLRISLVGMPWLSQGLRP